MQTQLRNWQRGRSPWTLVEGDSPIIATAIHDGHDLRPEVAAFVTSDERERRREEDPYTAALTEVVEDRVIVNRSRFEVDLNRPPRQAVCLDPDECWGIELWDRQLPDDVLAGSRRLHRTFYSMMGELLEKKLRRHERFVVLDIHSYNHRRQGPTAPPDDPAANPDVNIGTGSLDRARWGSLVDRFITDLSMHPLGLTVGENVKFRGRYLASWVHEEFRGRGCCLAVEFKKTYIDEWSGQIDEGRLLRLKDALAATIPGLEEELGVL